ncbi:PAS domain S-box protein [Aestuariivirga sp.]|uniref:hybrid sensor histidine kinase/response regulator n=1 Tax=Aestuariivirga sp. TaxID=2650926 RepID=UPI0035932D04
MNPPVNAASLNQPFTGWDELRSGAPAPTWKIEKPAVQTRHEGLVPFFPDQNGKVYEMLLASLPVMLHCMDGQGRITSVNRHWSASLGYTPDEVQGRSFNEFLTAESRARLVQDIYPSYFQSGVCRSELMNVIRRDGSTAQVLLSMNAYRGDKGRIERSVCLIDQPISVNLEQPVTVVDDQRFKGAFENAMHGMALAAPTGEISLANPAFWQLMGREPGQAAIDALILPQDRNGFLTVMSDLLQGGRESARLELRFSRPDGCTVQGETLITLVRSAEGVLEQLIVQVADASEKKQAASSLQRAQKMEAIGQLTGGLAHDFNNLLTVIIGNLELLEGKMPDDRSTKRLSEAINAARKGAGLTRQMLAFARKQELEPRDVRINELVAGIEPLIARTIGEQTELKADLMAGDPQAVIDPSQLESAILNLAINARDAMPKGGHLTIETQPVYLDAAYAEKHQEVTPGHYVMVAVSDTGTGMSPELLEKVFQPFFTTKEQGKGSGLGLSMVYGFIKQSGGHINVYSEVGHGTAVKMYLPRKFAAGEVIPEVLGVAPEMVQPAETETVELQPEPEAPRKPKILVVEDQEAVRAVACGFLQDFGYDVIEAEDGLQALAKLQENLDVDLMFSDVVMPGGLNGFDLAQAARGIRPDLKVVHTSGYPKGAMVHQEEPRFREGFIIMKPYRREDLQKIIRDALDFQS